MTDETLEKSVAKRCESCSAEFSCGAESEKCWCFAIELSPRTLAKLQEEFKNCLCKDCLLNYGKKEK
jgi:hypothetical protein